MTYKTSPKKTVFIFIAIAFLFALVFTVYPYISKNLPQEAKVATQEEVVEGAEKLLSLLETEVTDSSALRAQTTSIIQIKSQINFTKGTNAFNFPVKPLASRPLYAVPITTPASFQNTSLQAVLNHLLRKNLLVLVLNPNLPVSFQPVGPQRQLALVTNNPSLNQSLNQVIHKNPNFTPLLNLQANSTYVIIAFSMIKSDPDEIEDEIEIEYELLLTEEGEVKNFIERGNAPEGDFPTLDGVKNAGAIRHEYQKDVLPVLGCARDSEEDNNDEYDDQHPLVDLDAFENLYLPNIIADQNGFEIQALTYYPPKPGEEPEPKSAYLNVLFDLNFDGDWEDTGEWVVKNRDIVKDNCHLPIYVGYDSPDLIKDHLINLFSSTIYSLEELAEKEGSWARFTITSEEIDSKGDGIDTYDRINDITTWRWFGGSIDDFPTGETEDYFIPFFPEELTEESLEELLTSFSGSTPPPPPIPPLPAVSIIPLSPVGKDIAKFKINNHNPNDIEIKKISFDIKFDEYEISTVTCSPSYTLKSETNQTFGQPSSISFSSSSKGILIFDNFFNLPIIGKNGRTFRIQQDGTPSCPVPKSISVKEMDYIINSYPSPENKTELFGGLEVSKNFSPYITIGATPPSNIVTTGSTVEIARWKIMTTKPITIKDIILANSSPALGKDANFTIIRIYDSNDLKNPLGQGYFHNNSVTFQDINFTTSDSTTLVATADINTIASGAESGDQMGLTLTAIKTTEEISLIGQLSGNLMVIRKSKPDEINANPNSGGYSLRITAADSAENEDITIKKIILTVDGIVNGKELGFELDVCPNDALYIDDGKTGCSEKAFGNLYANNLPVDVSYNNVTTLGEDKTIEIIFANEVVIPWDGEKTFYFEGEFINADSDYINLWSARIKKPSTETITDNFINVANTPASIIWSDLSDPGHTNDWTNDFLLKGLPSAYYSFYENPNDALLESKITADITASMLTEKITTGEKKIYRLKAATKDKSTGVGKFKLIVEGIIDGKEIGLEPDADKCPDNALYLDDGIVDSCSKIGLKDIRIRAVGSTKDENISVYYENDNSSNAEKTITIMINESSPLHAIGFNPIYSQDNLGVPSYSKVYEIFGTFENVNISVLSKDYWKAFVKFLPPTSAFILDTN